jgi:hypothetical protein
MAEQTTFTIAWNHGSARKLEVIVDRDLPAFSPIENRVRNIAGTAHSHAGLRLLLLSAFADQWMVTEFPTVGGVTTVRMGAVALTVRSTIRLRRGGR